MVSTRNSTLIKSELIRYITSLGITVNTVTKARGNRGFFKEGRIDVSKTLDDDFAVRVLIHEFAHYSHFKLDRKMNDLDVLFGTGADGLTEELLDVTKFVDNNAIAEKLTTEKEKLATKIKTLTNMIKSTYPDFSSVSDFKTFKRYARFSDVRYLEKYDRVKVSSVSSNKLYTIATVKEDFPDIEEEFVAYLKLKSSQRRRAKISRRITKLKKYYAEPCELFARFAEGLYLDLEKVKCVAPNAYARFLERYNKNYYFGLREIFSIVRLLIY